MKFNTSKHELPSAQIELHADAIAFSTDLPLESSSRGRESLCRRVAMVAPPHYPAENRRNVLQLKKLHRSAVGIKTAGKEALRSVLLRCPNSKFRKQVFRPDFESRR